MKHGIIQYLFRIIFFLIIPVIFLFGCSEVKPVTESVRFAILGNTSPDSPFTGFTKSLPATLSEIESRKPQIIIHTGNALYGGSDADGILESDLKRQLDIFFPLLKKLHTAVYTIPGEKDYFNGSLDLYSRFSGRKAAYSFNYGSIHFIGLSSAEPGDSFIDDAQLKWLKDDLNDFNDYSAIFIFAHHQLFPDKKKNQTSEKREELHKLFLNYRVKAVFSGTDRDLNVKIKDSIKYINAGCNISADKKNSKKMNRFYIINFIDNEIEIDPVR